MDFISKQDYIASLNFTLEPVRKFLKNRISIPCVGSSAAWYSDLASYSETFLRPLWGLVPLWKGGHGDDEMKELYRRGIAYGTTPDSPGYWGETGERDQRFVEMAALAYALLLTPDIIWEPLTDSEKLNLTDWLSQINTHKVCDSNWIFFRILVNIALKHLGKEFSQNLLNSDLARIDEFYIGNGWYMDGPQHQKDYYISMAIHFYSLIYAMFETDSYAEKFRERAALFAKDYIYWFADNGAALPYGRSLIYRFAQGAFWSACILADVKGVDKSIIKGILSRHMKDWYDADIFDNGNILTIGYKYQNLLMAEHYNAPGSPYWALKAYALTALSDNDEFWDINQADMPELSSKKLIREADMLICRNKGEVYAYTAGTHDSLSCGSITSKYLKFVYSTKFGFNIKFGDVSIAEACGDNMLVFDVGGVFCERRFNYSFELSENKLVINWSPIRGIRVKTEVIPNGSSHMRIHTVNSEYDCTAYDGGFAVASRDIDGCTGYTGENFAKAENRFSSCKVISHSGGTGCLVNASPNTNLIYNKTVIPTVKYHIRKGTTLIKTEVIAD